MQDAEASVFSLPCAAQLQQRTVSAAAGNPLMVMEFSCSLKGRPAPARQNALAASPN
jgi:hypothetical protein